MSSASPTPRTSCGKTSICQLDSGSSLPNNTSELPTSTEPIKARMRGLYLSASRPPMGMVSPTAMAPGTIQRPASTGV